MPYSEVIEDFKKISNGQMPSQVPLFAISQEFDVAHYGITYSEYLADADTMFRVQAKAIHDFDYDWALFQLHDCLEFEPLGLDIHLAGDNILPGIGSSLPLSQETLNGLTIPDFKSYGKIRVFLDAMSKTKKEFGDDVLVVGRFAAPFTATTLLYGVNQTMMGLLDPEEKEIIRKTVDFFSEFQYAFSQEQRACGADAVWYGECLASSNFISIPMHREFVFDANKNLIEKMHQDGLLTIMEPADDKADFIKMYAEEGIDAINIGIGLDMAEAKNELQGVCGLLGNMDSIKFLQHGTPELVAEETERILQLGKAGGGYGFCTDSIPRFAKYENMKAMSEVVKANCVYA